MGERLYTYNRDTGEKQIVEVDDVDAFKASASGNLAISRDKDKLQAYVDSLPAADDADDSAGDTPVGGGTVEQDYDTSDVKAPQTTRAEALGLGASDMASFGLSDEAAGLMALAQRYAPTWMGGTTGGDEGRQGDVDHFQRTTARGIAAPLDERGAYAIGRDEVRDAQALAQEERPGYYATGQVLGGVATAALPVGSAARGATLAQMAARGAGAGAAVGGLAGFGGASGDAGEQLRATATGAGVGGVVGAVAPYVATGAGKAYRAGKDAILDFADRAAGGAARREIQYGSPELARAAEKLADPVEGAEMRRLAREGADPALLDAQAREAAEKVTALEQGGDKVKWLEDIASKKPIIRDRMVEEGVDARRAAANTDAEIESIAERVKTLAEKGYKGQDKAALSLLEKSIENYRRQALPVGKMARNERGKFVATKLSDEDLYERAADRYAAADQVKRDLQSIISKRSEPGGGSLVVDELRGVEDRMRTHLEAADVWGEHAASVQQVRNKGWRERLLLEGRESPARSFMREAGTPAADPYRIAREGDPTKLRAVLSDAGTLQGEHGRDQLLEFALREAQLQNALARDSRNPQVVGTASGASSKQAELMELLAQREKQNQAARTMEGVGQVKEEPSAVRKFLRAELPLHLNPLRPLIAERPASLGEKAAELSRLEAVATANPQNALAARRLQSAGVPGFAAPPRVAGPTRAIAASAPRITPGMTPAIATEPEQIPDQPTASLPGGAMPRDAEGLRQVLEADPTAFGAMSEEVATAIERGDDEEITGLIYRLQGDPRMRAKFGATGG